jgi:hypothetical protein
MTLYKSFSEQPNNVHNLFITNGESFSPLETLTIVLEEILSSFVKSDFFILFCFNNWENPL